jgi:hypothetical protein
MGLGDPNPKCEWNGHGADIIYSSSGGEVSEWPWSWQVSHFLTWLAVSLFIVGQKYAARRAFHANDFPPPCISQLPSWVSVRRYHISEGQIHFNSGTEFPLQYRCPSTTQNWVAFLIIFFDSTGSAGNTPLVIYFFRGVLQSSTFTWRITQGFGNVSYIIERAFFVGLVLSSLDSRSARWFFSLGICWISNLEIPSRLCFTFAKYF